MRTWKCWFKHLWETKQEVLTLQNSAPDIVIAWKQCERCAKSKLIHILQ